MTRHLSILAALSEFGKRNAKKGKCQIPEYAKEIAMNDKTPKIATPQSMLKRAMASEDTCYEAAMLADQNGMSLTNPSDGCFQLRHCEKGWILNLYPRRKGFTPRIYTDPNHRGPFLRNLLPEKWSLLDVVEAAIKKERDMP